MGKNKTTNKPEKKTAEFILTARPADDPDYNNPNVPQNILLYVPKDNDDENTQKTLDNIPESIRGNTFDEETQTKLVRERLGIEDSLNESSSVNAAAKKTNNKVKDARRKPKSDRPPVLFNEDANKELTDDDENENNESEEIDLEENEEKIDTKILAANKKDEKASNNNNNINNNKKPIGFSKAEKGAAGAKDELKSLTLKELLSSSNKEKLLEIDDKTLDLLIKKSNAKINAEMIHYNEYGLKSSVDPEVLEYVTDKRFREGVDLFIPAPNYAEVMQQNRVDCDINPEEMTEDYKEVYDALNNEDYASEAEDAVLEDDFILLANEGKLPIELLEDEAENAKDEILLVKTSNNFSGNDKKDLKQPSYKFITKEEKEFLDKQFHKTYEKFYEDEQDEENEENEGVLNANVNGNKKSKKEFEAVEEEEFEEYELSDVENAKREKANIKKTDMQSKEFNEAINELLPKHKRNNINNNNLNKNENENEEEEEEEEEFEEFDDNLLDDEYIRKQQELGDMESSLKYSEHLVLQEKGKGAGNRLKPEAASGFTSERKFVEKKNLVLKTKKKIEDEETIEDIEKFLYSKEVIEIDLKVISNMVLRDEVNHEADKAKEEADPAYELNYAKKHLDITSVGGTFGNMPKVIAIEGDPKKLQKKLRKDEKFRKEKEAKSAAKSEEVDKVNKNSNSNKVISKANLNDNVNNVNVNVKNVNEIVNGLSKNNKKEKIEEFDYNKEIKAVINNNNNNNVLSGKSHKADFAIGKEFLEEKLNQLDDSDLEEDNSDKDEEDVNFNELEEKHRFENNDKEANKLRKKMLKKEKMEKRKLKKEIKLAFKVKYYFIFN